MQPPCSELVRGTVSHPGKPSTNVVFFLDWQRAVCHLRDHVLTPPESAAWAIIVPGFANLIDLGNADHCNAFYRQAEVTRGVSAQAVFDLYRQAADRAANEARVLVWHRSQGSTTVALGTSGALVLINGTSVSTVYVPGHGSAVAVREAREGETTGLRRQRRLMRGGDDRPQREQRQQAQREASWSTEERLFYDVFRPVVQFLRGRYHLACTLDGQRYQDDALLKEVLPKMSQLKLEHWRQYRAQAGAGGVA
jgi:hypothetical protein